MSSRIYVKMALMDPKISLRSDDIMVINYGDGCVVYRDDGVRLCDFPNSEKEVISHMIGYLEEEDEPPPVHKHRPRLPK